MRHHWLGLGFFVAAVSLEAQGPQRVRFVMKGGTVYLSN